MNSSLLMSMVFLMAVGSAAMAKTVEVCKTCAITTLTAALQASQDGDTILVKAGLYDEAGLQVRHSLNLIGENGAELRHQGDSGDAILVLAARTRIEGLKITGSGKSSFHDFAAIKVQNTSDCEIKDNEIVNSQYGIMIANTPGCRIIGNKIHTTAVPVDLLGDAVHLWKSDRPEIRGNILHGHRDGIYLEFVQSGSIHDNEVVKNHRYGLHFMFSSENTFQDNIFRDNDAGVAVMYSKKIKMIRNVYARNHGAASFGLLLKDISDSWVEANIFEENTVAIFMEGSNRNQFERNRFDKNGWALRLLSSCDSNIFKNNFFLDNTLEIATNSHSSQNRFSQNYWAQHKKIDLDRDGFADLPYQPTSFSSYLVEKYNLSVILLGTPFLSLLDRMEKIFPALSPVDLRDDKPLMSFPGGPL